MENMLNQKPPNSNFMDHLYCHPNEASNKKNYAPRNKNNSTTTTTTAAAAAAATTTNNNENNKTAITIKTEETTNDTMLQDEVNSLKSMLLFHFDLIQTQAEQLQAKELELKTQRVECEKLRARNTQLMGQVADMQQQLEEQMKRNMFIKRTSLPPPPLAKIQCLNENINNNKGLLSGGTCAIQTSIQTPTIVNTTLADKTRMAKLATVAVQSNQTIVKNNQTKIIAATQPALVVKEDKTQTINTKLKTNNVLNNAKEKQEVQQAIKIADEEKEKVTRDKANCNQSNEPIEIPTSEKFVKFNKSIEGNDMKRSSSTLCIKVATGSSETPKSLSSIHSSTTCSSPASSTTLKGKRRRVWQVPELATDEESVNSFDSMLDIETVSYSYYYYFILILDQ